MTFQTPEGVQTSVLAATGLSSSWWVAWITDLNGPLATLLTLLSIILVIVKIIQVVRKGGET